MTAQALQVAAPGSAARGSGALAAIEPFARGCLGEGPEQDTLPVRQAKVMIVDDEALNIDVVQSFLEDAGYCRFVSTSESRSALDLLFNEQPDVLLLDLMMPEVSGFDIMERIREDPTLRHIPVIVLTASSDPKNKLAALELNATDFLAKPVDPSELVLRVRNTLAAKAYQDRLAYYDSLTGLPNRRKYLAHLDWALRQSMRVGRAGAMLHVGLDRFKQINEGFGPAVGDRLLQEVAQRLRQSVSGGGANAVAAEQASQLTISRLGNDEFAVLLPMIEATDGAAAVAVRILERIAGPYDVAGHEIHLTCSVGIAAFPDDGTVIEAVQQSAGIAMHYAKQRGGNLCQFYSQGLNAHALHRLSMEAELRKALERDEMHVFYQPKFDVQSGRLSGAEALLRWQHRERGLISPAEFIPVAEEAGLIVPLGEWVLRAVCLQIKAWQSAGQRPPRIAVNVSGNQFRQQGIAETVRRALEASRVEPHLLTLELTESVVMENVQHNMRQLKDIKQTGIKISIDDFGTGYSSLSYLLRLPLDELKVDRSFVKTIGEEGNSGSLVVAIIAIAHSLGLNVVAEGVETQAQLDFLKAHGCDECQGFLLGRPLTAEAFASMLRPAPLLVCAKHRDGDEAPGASTAPLVSSLAGQPRLHPILRKFPASLNARLAVAERAWNESNAEQIAGFAHWLAGSGGTMGYHDFTEPARALERLAMAGSLGAPEASSRFAQIRSLASRIVVPAGDTA